MNDILAGAFVTATLFLPACRTAPAPRLGAAASAPYYRFFRGAKRPDLSPQQLREGLSSVFIPALPEAYADKGALAYLPALPPESKPAEIADEFALVAFQSEAAYRAARQTPEGRRYNDLHWTVFDRERTRTGGAVPLAEALAAETPYDVLGKPVDWQSGYSTFYIGLRKAGVTPEDFLKKMREHVAVIRDALAPQGLDGYVMIAGEGYEAAYLHWPSREAADKAFASAGGRAAVATAAPILDNLMFAPTEPFAGTIQPGQALNVRFERRAP